MRKCSGWYLLAMSTLALACASGPWQGNVYRHNALYFEVERSPTGFYPVELDQAVLALRSDERRATVALFARCGRDGDDVPLSALTQHLFMQFSRREVLEQRELSLDGRGALFTRMRARLDGVEKGFVVYVLKKDGCVYDFLFVSDQPLEESPEVFERFVHSFRTLPR
jgi:hypothetical protein